MGDKWGDRSLAIGGAWTNIFTGESIEGESLPLAKVFASFPVAVLVSS